MPDSTILTAGEEGTVTRHTGETHTETHTEPPAPDEKALDESERAELERLRAEVARLRTEPGRAEPGRAEPGTGPVIPPRRPGRARRWGRTTLAVLLIAIACILSPLSVVAVWARGEVTDTDRYVDTVAPLANDPAVQEAMTTDITNTVFQYIDIQGLTQRAFAALADRGTLPPDLAASLQGLAVPVANGVRSFTEDQVRKVVQSDLFAQAWEAANRAAHEQLVAALSGQGGGAVVVEGNAVKLDVAAFVATVKARLVDSGFQLAARIPQVNATFTIFESSDVSKVQRGFHLLDRLGLWLPFILVALAALGIFLARNHRLAFIGAGFGVALAMLAAAIALAATRNAYLDGVPQDVLPTGAAAVLFDTVVRFLREALRAAFLIGLLVVLGAFLTGPSVTAVTIRRWLVAGFAWVRGWLAAAGADLEGVTAWVAPRARLLRGLVVAATFLVLLLVRYRTPALVGWLTLAVLACLAIIQFLATPPAPPRHPPLPHTAPAVPAHG
jgi:hypothetical protein